jgi:hypothetical protein
MAERAPPKEREREKERIPLHRLRTSPQPSTTELLGCTRRRWQVPVPRNGAAAVEIITDVLWTTGRCVQKIVSYMFYGLT